MPQVPRRIAVVLVLLVAVVLVMAVWRIAGAAPRASDLGAGLEVLDAGEPVAGLPDSDRPSQPPAATSTVTVHVAGPVVHPGVVVLPTGARVADAIAACGGFVPEATTATVNLARLLVDGERLDVDAAPEGGAAAGESGASGASGEEPGPIDINSATSAQLQELPGVGPVMADRIVAYREEHGRFASVDQLDEVPGIGESRLADLAELVVAGPG